ncbi:MAG: hypothetical protein EPO25_06305 [Gammaproteobacteria bacterium]|nr:MAG: hypothetical protein EPO25_06305 [Gammaproteobacteria bacterium]
MHRLRVLRNSGGVTEVTLLAALRQGTNLPVDVATSLARAVVVPPAHIDWASDSDFPVEQVADVLIEQGFEVGFDA